MGVSALETVEWLAAIGGLIFGLLVCVLKDLSTRSMADAYPNGFLKAALIRQAFNLVCVVSAWAVGSYFSLPLIPLLIGAALGVTLPTIIIYGIRRKKGGANGQKKG